jgi:hypothetical protein
VSEEQTTLAMHTAEEPPESLVIHEELRKRIHAESLKAAEIRHNLDMQKIVFIAGIVAIGGLKIENAMILLHSLYLVPVVAISTKVNWANYIARWRRTLSHRTEFASAEWFSQLPILSTSISEKPRSG